MAVTNQSIIYRLVSDARSRVNSGLHGRQLLRRCHRLGSSGKCLRDGEVGAGSASLGAGIGAITLLLVVVSRVRSANVTAVLSRVRAQLDCLGHEPAAAAAARPP